MNNIVSYKELHVVRNLIRTCFCDTSVVIRLNLDGRTYICIILDVLRSRCDVWKCSWLVMPYCVYATPDMYLVVWRINMQVKASLAMATNLGH